MDGCCDILDVALFPCYVCMYIAPPRVYCAVGKVGLSKKWIGISDQVFQDVCQTPCAHHVGGEKGVKWGYK